MKKMKKLCCGALIAGFMLTQIAGSGNSTSEAAGTGWKQDKSGWYYEYSSGKYAKNEWLKSGGKWYYFNAKGYMVKSWQKIGKKWYFFGTDGKMRTGWQKIGGKWYFFGSNGMMQTGWKKQAGKWYYFNADGTMVTGTKTIGGKSYTFDSSGVMKEDSSASSLANAKVGDTIKFGKYEQDNKTSNGKEDIEWIVLDKDNSGKLFVVSKYVLDNIQYNTKRENVTWETCSLRKWLNSTFMNDAFNSTEKAMIQTTDVINKGNPWNTKVKGGKNTKDSIFLLSIDEAKKYFPNDKSGPFEGSSEARACKVTAYALAQGVDAVNWENDFSPWDTEKEFKKYDGYCISWWLRTPGTGANDEAADVLYSGVISNEKNPFVDWTAGLRPAMWIKP